MAKQELVRREEDWRLEVPFKDFQYLDVLFQAADTDTYFNHNLKTDDPEAIRWIDISPGTVYTGGIDTVAHIYRSSSPTRKRFTPTAVALRSTVAGYRTRLLLVVER